MLKELKVNPLLWISTFLLVLVWSAIHPKDTFTWFLEVAPALIGFTLLAYTYKSFPLTRLLYILILIHCIILMVGGHYTYAEVPFFDWLKLEFDWSRNNYDKVGHFAQGFVPVLIAREILIRKQVVNGLGWTNFFSVSIALAFSAFYELIEWWVALMSEEAAESFLGTQGYVWDTQSDMGWALLGGIVVIVFLSKIHNRQIAQLENNRKPI
jgi:putative membrane protein